MQPLLFLPSPGGLHVGAAGQSGPAAMQPPGRVRSLAVELEDGRAWGAYGSGELLHGRVRLELRGALRLRALEVCARGRAIVHWLESRSVGLNIVYHDYTAFQTFLNRRRQLIPGKAGAGERLCAAVRSGPRGLQAPLWAHLRPPRAGAICKQGSAS